MITHDQIGRRDPRADLIRFKSLGEGLSRGSNEVVLITLNGKGRYEEGYHKGSKVYKIPLLSKVKMIQLFCFTVFLLPTVFRARQGRQFDIIFINSVLSIPGVILYRYLSGDGFIQFDLMGLISEEKFLLKQKNFWMKIGKKMFSFLENSFLSQVDFITTINDKHKQIIQSRIRRPVYVIRDGVHEDILKPSVNLSKEKKDTGGIVLIFVGQLNHFRLDPLFRAMADLTAELPSLHLQILGSGPQFDRYRRMTDHLGLKGNVSFEGYISHEKIFDYIAMADIAYSDDWSINGFPMKIFEYMAMGKPVIAEETESIKELMSDNTNALLYKNESELKEKLLLLARDEELRMRIGENGKRIIRDHVWGIRTKTLHSIYLEYMGKGEDEICLNH
jgi:glycosyltransferase involved in cell wall biosynthesis